jgi:predicted HNH restriction endonuclease
MAEAKKCDRCGSFYEERDPNFIESLAYQIRSIASPRKHGVIYSITSLIDLCPNCSKSLKNWVQIKEGSDCNESKNLSRSDREIRHDDGEQAD